MSKGYKKVVLEPVSRIEGKARITFEIDESNNDLKKAEFNVLEFRAFEKFLEGRKAREIPRITPRICGICPVSHHLASAKATDMLARVMIPERGKLHRELMHMGQYIHSHSLHIYFLALPDFIDGFRAESNDFRLILNKNPNLLKKVIKFRAFGQRIIEVVGGKAIHPVTAIPGGISVPITQSARSTLLNEAKELFQFVTNEMIKTGWELLDAVPEEMKQYETLTTHNMGTISENKEIALYDGETRIVDAEGNVKGSFRGAKYRKMIEEKHYSFSWTKSPYLVGVEDEEEAILQVGPLARQKCYDSIPTDYASNLLTDFRNKFGRFTVENYANHYARLVETCYAFEKAIEILENPNLMKEADFRVTTTIKESTGVGILEAPRGTLIHSFKTDSNGFVNNANIIVSTTFNNPAINLALFKVAKNQFKSIRSTKNISDAVLRRIESTVRVFDPCLTCSSHSINKNNFNIRILNNQGKVIFHH
jgi:coenzyme F420-reducing hydrogenase alpha subunit